MAKKNELVGVVKNELVLPSTEIVTPDQDEELIAAAEKGVEAVTALLRSRRAAYPVFRDEERLPYDGEHCLICNKGFTQKGVPYRGVVVEIGGVKSLFGRDCAKLYRQARRRDELKTKTDAEVLEIVKTEWRAMMKNKSIAGQIARFGGLV